MKNLITATACIVLLLAVLIQIIHIQKLYLGLIELDHIGENLRHLARINGCVDEDSKLQIKKQITELLSCSGETVEIGGTDEVKKRGEVVNYNMKVPIRNVFRDQTFWGIPLGSKSLEYKVNRYTISDYIDSK